MERPEDLTRRVLQLADNWPEIERVVDASMGDLYGRGRGGRDRGVGEVNLDAPGNTPSVPARDQREHQDEYYSKECS